MAEPEVVDCKSCSAKIMFVKTVVGFTPIDAEPNPTGGIALVDGKPRFGGNALRYFEEYPDAPRYISHFATCPDAAKHRRTR
jgi:hypothetical protein